MQRFAPVLGVVLAGGILTWAGLNPARSQSSDAALKDRVSQLLERLDAPKVEARKAAEEALIKLGPKALPLLPEAEKVSGAERKERLGRVREALKDASEQLNLGAT